jgi:hypothetical protein
MRDRRSLFTGEDEVSVYRRPRRCRRSVPLCFFMRSMQSGTLRLVRLRVRTNRGVEVPIGQSTGCQGDCVAERRGGEQPEANDQSIIKKMMNSIRPDALASLLGEGEAQNGSRPGKGKRQLRDRPCGENSERRDRNAWGGWR